MIANGQRCVNLFPETNRKDSPTAMTHYQRPGLVPVSVPTTARAARCCYQASNGDGYIVIGPTVYYVSSSWTLHSIGTINNDFNTPVSMVDNGIEAIIVIGVPYAGNAAGSILFAANPSAAQTITLNGVVWTFIAGASSGTNVQIGGTLGLTMANLLTQVNASVNSLITVAYYNWRTVGADARFEITYKTSGSVGTAYTLAASTATPSGATLVLGTVFPGIGYTFTLGSLSASAVTQMVDAAWTGADRVDFIDTFILWNMPGTRNFGSTLSNDILPLDATYIAGKTSWPDFIVGLVVCQEQIFLMGTQKSEIWYNAGGAAFPFARQPGTSIQHGCVAKFSLVTSDLDVFWLSSDLQGKGVVLRCRGSDVKRVSNFALEYQISLMSDITDAVAYTFLQAGHLFYVLSFPTGNQTWVFDSSVADPELAWSQRAWTDLNGGLNRDRGAFGAVFYGYNVCLDWENGTLYKQDPTVFTDTISTNAGGARAYPLTFLRTFPHLMAGMDMKTGQPVLANGKMVKHNRFAIDAECGTAETSSPKFMLTYSDDRGKTWSGKVELAAGEQGQYISRPDATPLGQAMDRVYEVSWSFPGKVALNGAWVDGEVLPR